MGVIMIPSDRSHLPIIKREVIGRRQKDRHYYLEMARLSAKRREITDMHLFSELAEREQAAIDHYCYWYPPQEHEVI